MKRRCFSIPAVKAFLLYISISILYTVPVYAQQHNPTSEIIRFDLVNRHNISHSEINPLNSLTVGNGEFAFTADITGLQSFPEFHEEGIPLGTQSQWGWHSFPNPENYSLEDVYKKYRVGEDSIPYVYQYTGGSVERKNNASQWLRENPHRLHLGLVGLELYNNEGHRCQITDIEAPVQKLNLWKGELKSYFETDGVPVEVITYCHQEMDMVSFRINSKLISTGRLKIKITFPYASHDKFSPAYDLHQPDKHTTQILDSSSRYITFKRTLDDEQYFVTLNWKGDSYVCKNGTHEFILEPSGNDDILEVSCSFSNEIPGNILPGFTKTAENNRNHWEKFWNSGGAVDFSKCTDPRAFELERRMILSQYLTKVQCTGSLPPQETGLTYNSWHGKFHLEMHWWHAVHFVLWKRPQFIEKQFNYYTGILEKAENTAKLQGYQGARWPKMVGPDGRESPSTIGTFLIWQQPHIIYFSELLYRSYDEDKRILEKYKNLVFSTAGFMASYARWDSTTGRYVLGPALIPAQERFAPETTINPSFELAYWYWGLQTAQKWRERLNLEKDKHWQHVLTHLSALPVKDSLYLFTEDASDSYTHPDYLTDHPMVLGILGFLPPTDIVERTLMEKTLEKIITNWNWETIWGWDILLAAMNATLLNRPELAVDVLLMDTPKNTYLLNGHNYQDEILTLYLPGNGGLLTAIAMMCTYRNENGKNGFPDNGKWEVQYENLRNMY